jgi:hypothetical protein
MLLHDHYGEDAIGTACSRDSTNGHKQHPQYCGGRRKGRIARSWSCWILWVVSLGASVARRPCRVSLLTAPSRPWPLPPRALGLPVPGSTGIVVDLSQMQRTLYRRRCTCRVPARHAHQSWCCIPAVDALAWRVLGRAALGGCFVDRCCAV